MKKALLAISVLSVFQGNAQDLAFGRKIVDTLTASYFWGRGYTNNGMQKAADFISGEFSAFGLKPISGTDYFQHFSYPVNTFPNHMEMTVDGKKLTPGKDFIISPESRGFKGHGNLEQIDTNRWADRKHKVEIVLESKLTWSAKTRAEDHTIILVNKTSLDQPPSYYKSNIDNRLIKDFQAVNVCGMVKGTSKPDSVIVITAHYDHLGGMGEDTYFPGANDNASGTALLLNLARYYAKNPQPYSIAFICFAGEEIGLKGSKYYTEHPLLPLKNIRFLLNTDLAGNGDDGITIVNATEFPREFEWMKQINEKYHLLPNIYSRGKAANSDHYHFTEKGVPSFFFYTQGGISAYHDIYDIAKTLPLKQHENLFKLVIKFNEKLMGLN